MSVPNTYTSVNETGCCPIPNIQDWQDKEITFDDKPFIRMHTKSFMYVPLNMGKVMKAIDETATQANVKLPIDQGMILSSDISPWRAEQYYAVTAPIEGADNVNLNGTFLSRVFEGPYKNAQQWYKNMVEYAKQQGKEVKKLYFFYTTCPKCAKHYGKNYVVALAEV